MNDVLRAEQLDEGLAILTGLMSSERLPTRASTTLSSRRASFLRRCQKRIPIWIAATWPRPRPFRRAAKYHGVASVSPDLEADLTVGQMREVRALIAKNRKTMTPFDIIQFATTAGRSDEEDAHKVAAFAEAGVTLWFEAPSPWKLTIAQVRDLIRSGRRRFEKACNRVVS